MLTPVTTVNSGRLPVWVQPLSRPAANAPSEPPPDIASHGPLFGGSTFLESSSVSPQTRASGNPGTTAAAASSAVYGIRGGSPLGVIFGAALVPACLALALALAFAVWA